MASGIGIPGGAVGVNPDIPVITTVLPRVDTWTFASGPFNGGPDTEISTANTRTVNWRLGPADNSEASFAIDGRSEPARNITETVSALWVLRNGVELYRGLVGASTDTVDADSHSVQFSSADWRALLTRRFIYDHDQLIYSDTDQAQVMWDLLTASQARAGGDLGIIQGIGNPTGVTISPQYTAGASLYDTINTQAQSTQGFDWDIRGVNGSNNLTFDVWAGQRGNDKQTVLDYPGRIQSFTRNADPGAYADAIRASGGNGLAAILTDSPNINTDATPRLEALLSNTDITTQSALADWAAGQLAVVQTVTPSWTVTLAPNSWQGPDVDFWLGDPVILAVDSGRLQVNESLRVIEMDLTIGDDDDAATVAVTLGAAKPERRWQLRVLSQAITKLSKR